MTDMSKLHEGYYCEDPDFTVITIPNGDKFLVRRDRLVQGSEIFRKSSPRPSQDQSHLAADKYAENRRHVPVLRRGLR